MEIMKENNDKRLCGYCNKPLYWCCKTKHTNIHNNPITLFFCNKECRTLWMIQLKKVNKNE